MKAGIQGSWKRLLDDERGQVLPVAAVMMVAVLSALALVTDVGHAMYSQRELQATTDAAALAGAAELRTATTVSQVTSEATLFSAVSGNGNARGNLPNVSMVPGYPVAKCLVTLQNEGMACVGNVPYNAVQVKQKATIPLVFGSFIGHPTVTVGASATASVNGGSPTPYNVAVIIDTTLSMNNVDANCQNNTQMQCALNGFQVLLQNLDPCPRSLTSCVISNGVSQSSVDRVSLFTFPPVTTTSATYDSTCLAAIPPTSNPGWNTGGATYNLVLPPNAPAAGVATATAYWFPQAGASNYITGSAYEATTKSNSSFATANTTVTSTYQVLPFMSDYKTSAFATTLNPASALVTAAGAVTSCGGMGPSNYDGVYGTYYAGVIYAAQSALVAEQATNPGSQNALILLSDGDSTAGEQTVNGAIVPSCCTANNYYVFGSTANALGIYPSYVGECGQAIVAAQAATAAGTRVYSIAYGSEPTGCLTDKAVSSYPGVSPCDTMADIASAPQYFYSDYNQTGSGSTCYASQPITSLSGILKAIANDLSTARLIPDSTT